MALLIVVLIAACAMGFAATAEKQGNVNSSISWVLSDAGVLTISGTGILKDPQSNNNSPFKSIADQVKSVVINEGIAEIGHAAFRKLPNLTSVSIPASVKTINVGAFIECTGLKSISIPDTVENMYNSVFSDCTALTTVKLPTRLPRLFPNTFSGCSSLKSITIPNTVQSIDSRVFAYCTNLTSVTIPEGVTSLGEWLFYQSTKITSLDLPGTITSINKSCFYESGVTTLSGDCDNTYVKEYAESHSMRFAARHIEKIDYYYVAPTCTKSGHTKGSHCTRCNAVLASSQYLKPLGHQYVTDAEVAATCTEPGLTGGYHCSRCGYILTPQETVPATGHTEELLAEVPPTYETTGLTEGKRCSVCGETLQPQREIPCLIRRLEADFITPESLVEIRESAFHGIAAEAVELTGAVKRIDSHAFEGCVALKQITIPAGVESIAPDAFEGCPADMVIFGAFDTPAEAFANEAGFTFADMTGRVRIPE